MLGYYLKLAWLSIKRNPILSALMVTAIALGIGASMTTLTVNYMMSNNPIPTKSHQLFYVQLDNWDPNDPFDEPNEPPDQVTFKDAWNLLQAKQAERQVAMAKTNFIVEPDTNDVKPFHARGRLTSKDFFAMFSVPFLYGQGWDQTADDNGDLVVVITKALNEKLFNGDNSVGQSIRMQGRQYRIVGVLNTWDPTPQFYDVTNGAFGEPEDVFVPFILKRNIELPNSGNTNCWKAPEGDGFEAFLQSECVNYQFWVELPDDNAKHAYMSFLDNYVTEQKKLGRFQRPLNNRLSDVMEWMEKQGVVTDDATMMMYMSFMFLVVCLLNTIGLLLTKFVGKAGELALRRAVGASRKQLYWQHLVETGLIGFAGGIFGLLLAWLGLVGVRQLYGDTLKPDLAQLDANLVLIGIVLAVVSSMLAGLYPTWRACRIPPASQLKTQ